MSEKKDVAIEKLPAWDEYKSKEPEAAISSIYRHIEETSKKLCDWYWASIHSKRTASILVRAAAFSLLVVGTILQIAAAMLDKAETRLEVTQLALVSLAVAALLQVADRVFGWSSGWMRYITTVMTMENLTRAFQMEWAKYLVTKTGPLNSADVKTLFDLAYGLEKELTKLQAEETTKWVADFNTGISLLETMIKTQREEVDKKLEAIRTTLTSQQGAAKAEEKAKTPGALEITLSHQGETKKIKIGLDDETLADFLGQVWARNNVPVGRHSLKIITSSEPPHTIDRIIEIKPDTTSKEQVTIRA